MTIGKKSKQQVAKIREAVLRRDGERCVAAGVFGFCGGPLTIQHRVGRGMGGSAQYDTMAHLVTMCQTHNELQTASAKFNDICQHRGWSVPRWATEQTDVQLIPVWYPWKGWFTLWEDGSVRQATELEASAVYLALYGRIWSE